MEGVGSCSNTGPSTILGVHIVRSLKVGQDFAINPGCCSPKNCGKFFHVVLWVGSTRARPLRLKVELRLGMLAGRRFHRPVQPCESIVPSPVDSHQNNTKSVVTLPSSAKTIQVLAMYIEDASAQRCPSKKVSKRAEKG